MVCLYSGCRKQNETLTHIPDTKAIGPPIPIFDKVCGKYLVSYSFWNDVGYMAPIYKDTIVILKCGDSSVYCPSLSESSSWVACCSYPPSSAAVNCFANYFGNNYSANNYLFANYNSSYYLPFESPVVFIYFPANHPDSIYIDAGKTNCGITEYATISGAKIR